MIKAVLSQDDGADTLVLGLSTANIRRLMQGMPIVVEPEECGLYASFRIAIVWGETEQTIVDDLRAVLAGAGLPDLTV